MSYGDRFLARLRQVDAACVAAGGVPISPAWWQTIERFVRSGKRQIVVRKGRRIGASTIIAPRLAVTALLCSAHPVPPGEVTAFAFVSVKRKEAMRRLRNVAAVLDALAITYDQHDDTIEPHGFGGRQFQTLTASFRTEVGQTIEWLWCDEVTRWIDGETHANPATEVLAALSPSLLTVTHAQRWIVSSPMGLDDLHARLYDEGEHEGQATAFLPTWIGNPTLTEAQTHIEESDPKKWAREYAAQPQHSVSPAFDAEHVARCFGADITSIRRGSWGPRVVAIDASAGGSCEFVALVARYWHPPEGTGIVPAEWLDTGVYRDLAGNDVTPDHFERLAEPFVPCWGSERNKQYFARDEDGHAIPLAGAIHPGPLLVIYDSYVERAGWAGRLPLSAVVANAASCGARYGFGDSYLGVALEEAFANRGVRYVPMNWSTRTKGDAVAHLRHLMGEGRIWIPGHMDQLRQQMLRYAEIVLPSGAIKYSGRRQGHLDDWVSALLSLAMADAEGMFPRERPGPPRVLRSFAVRQSLTYTE